ELRRAREDVRDAVHRAIGAEAAVAALDDDQVGGGRDAGVAVGGPAVAGRGTGPGGGAGDVRAVADDVRERAARDRGAAAFAPVVQRIAADLAGRLAGLRRLVPCEQDARAAVGVAEVRVRKVEPGVVDADDDALPRHAD